MNSRHFCCIFVLSILFLGGGQLVFSDERDDYSAMPALYKLLFSQELKTATKLIVAEQGGSLKIAGISLNIPPDALNEDTEITLSSVDVSQYDGDAASGGMDNLHITGALVKPSGIVLKKPVVVRFSLPYNWDSKTEVIVSAANGNDPLDVLQSTEEITISGASGNYTAEISVSHFSIFNISRICHEGAVNNTVAKFQESSASCTDEAIKAQVLDKYNIPIDPPGKDKKGDAIKMGTENIQAYLGTYFDTLGSPYDAGEDISTDTIDYLKEQARNGRQVIIAFNVSATWPERDGTHAHNFYRSFPHTANIEYHYDPGPPAKETFLVRHTLSTGGFLGSRLTDLRNAMGEDVISYTDPLDNINTFRTKLSGELLKEYVQTKYPTLPADFIRIGPRKYGSVNIYVDRRDDSSQNACDLNLKDRQNCLCSTACNLPGTEFWCRYDTEFLGWSPSCRDLSNGPCICTAYGCNRRQMVTSGDCYDSCMEKYPEPSL